MILSSHPIFERIDQYLLKAEKVMIPSGSEWNQPVITPSEKIKVGVDLGTAYLVMVVLDGQDQPILGEYRFAQVVRDGLVVDFMGAIDIIKTMKNNLESKIGREITQSACGYPPGVPLAEVRANANVIEAAGMDCSGLVDEPSAANRLLQIRDGAIIDIGGGTTGIAIVKNGEVIYTADEATGGTHFSLVIAGASGIEFEEAEEIKKKDSEQERLFPVVRPVMEKIGTIVLKHISGFTVDHLFLVGGSSCFPGIEKVIEEITGLPTSVPTRPLFITPIGIAMTQKI